MRHFKTSALVVLILCASWCSAQDDEDAESSLELNDSCKTPNDKTAQCISIYDCRALYDQLTSAKQSRIDFLRASDCGVHQGVPLVCCGEDVDFDKDHGPIADGKIQRRNRTRTRIPSTDDDQAAEAGVNLASRFAFSDEDVDRSTKASSGIAGRNECGFMAEQNRILGGIVTAIDEFPWMALLQYQRKSDGRRRFLCGGSLIGKRYVLTAAHCVVGEIEKTHRVIGVRLGEFNIQEENDCIRFGNYVDCADPPQDVRIERVTAHPRFDETLREKPNDIALIRLDRDISYTDFIRPICLPTVYDSTPAGKHLIVAGWGRTESAVSSAVKLKLTVPVASHRTCRSTFRRAGANIRDMQICAGGQSGRDSCTGDSGGPLMTVLAGNADQWYVEGIVSFGATCGLQGWPGVYTKVSAYLDWINENAV